MPSFVTQAWRGPSSQSKASLRYTFQHLRLANRNLRWAGTYSITLNTDDAKLPAFSFQKKIYRR